MKIFAISDLHLSTTAQKPMDIFGDGWQNHFEKIKTDWDSKVSDDDLVLLGGDMSWGTSLDEAESDLNLLKDLKGEKLLLKGNHDYWWSSLNKISAKFPFLNFLQNNCYKKEKYIIAGSRGWNVINNTTTQEDLKIFERELIRLELSLKSAVAIKTDETIIALLHFPPFDADFKNTPVTDLLEKYGVQKVLYGHLHGKDIRVRPRIIKNNIEYILTSCDLVNYKLIEV